MVELNEDVQNDLSKGLTGKYTKGIGTYAGRPYWRKGDKAIWYHEEKWMIGKDMYLGASSQSLQSMDSTFCPDSVDANWKYSTKAHQDAGKEKIEWKEPGSNAQVVPYYMDITDKKGYFHAFISLHLPSRTP